MWGQWAAHGAEQEWRYAAKQVWLCVSRRYVARMIWRYAAVGGGKDNGSYVEEWRYAARMIWRYAASEGWRYVTEVEQA